MADLTIGLVAHWVIGNLCFVKVPSERGRYMLTDICVIGVPCPVCEAIVGEPCRKYYGLRYWDERFPEKKPQAHGVTVHCERRSAAREKFGRNYTHTLAQRYHVHIPASDLAAASGELPDPIQEVEPREIAVRLERKGGTHAP